MPSGKNYVRDYKQENKTAKARGETGNGSGSGDAMRHKARRKVIKRIGKAAVQGKDVDHKVKLKNGGGNGTKNLRVRGRRANRADNR